MQDRHDQSHFHTIGQVTIAQIICRAKTSIHPYIHEATIQVLVRVILHS